MSQTQTPIKTTRKEMARMLAELEAQYPAVAAGLAEEPAPLPTSGRERAARINLLKGRRDWARAQRDFAYDRADEKAEAGDMSGWQEWLLKALTFAEQLDNLTAESDALAALCL